MRKMSPEFQASLERGLTELFISYPEIIEKIFSPREILRLTLENKFGPLSEEIVSRLSAVSDVDELDKMFRRALDAQTLDEVGIPEDDNA